MSYHRVWVEYRPNPSGSGPAKLSVAATLPWTIARAMAFGVPLSVVRERRGSWFEHVNVSAYSLFTGQTLFNQKMVAVIVADD
jgi:hypothetical protein